MNIQTQPRDDHQVTVTAEVEPAQLERFRHIAARKLSQEKHISGFRPGKAPYPVVVRMVGEQALTEYAIELMVDEIYPQILEESKIVPGAQGKLENVVSIDPPIFEFVIPLEPDVNLGEYRAVRQEYAPEAVTEEDIDNFLTSLRQGLGSLQPAERPAEEKDMLYLSVKTLIVGETIETEPLREMPLEVTIEAEDKQSDDEVPFKGFARQLIGHSDGETVLIPYTYPTEYSNEELRGKSVQFETQIQAVKTMVLPAVDDDFAKKVADFDNVAALHDAIEHRLSHSKQDKYDDEFMSAIIEEIRKGAVLKYPPQLVEDEVEKVLEDLRQRLSRQNLDMETYFKWQNTTRDEFVEKEVRPVAVQRLERSLIIDAIVRAEKITPDVNRMDDFVRQTVFELQRETDFNKMRKEYGDQKLSNLVANEAAGRLLMAQLFERLRDIATGKADEPAEVAVDAEAPASEEVEPTETEE